MQLTLYAPSSNLEKISKQDDALSAWIDLSGLGEGIHDVPIQYQIPTDIRPIRVISASPDQTEITIEELITATYSINTEINGEPALGYQAETPSGATSKPQYLADHPWCVR